MQRRMIVLARVLAGAGLAAAVLPATAAAHGLSGRSDLPLPSWLFGWAASLVLVVSFVGLAVLWQQPRLEQATRRELWHVPRWVDVAAGAFGVVVFLVVVYAGFAGTRTAPFANLAPTFIYVVFWVGLVPVSAFFGNVFGALSPWRAVARLVAWAGGRAGRPRTPRPYPPRLGFWPAATGIVTFAWIELVLVLTGRDDPRLLAVLAVLYAAFQLAGMQRYGIEPWTRHGDAFAVYFGLFASIAPLVREGDKIYRRLPLSGLSSLEVGPGSVALLCAIIGSTTFDGLSNGQVWTYLLPKLSDLFSGAGANGSAELAGTIGLAGSIALVAGLYRLGVGGMSQLGPDGTARLSLAFVHTLVPIAFAYAMAHYFSLLVFQGQAMGYLVSDPLGDGSNIFGTAAATIDYKVMSSAAVWYVQTGLLVVGHVAGLALAHDRALTFFKNQRMATRSQYWMLAVMVGYTSLGLWLLSTIKV